MKAKINSLIIFFNIFIAFFLAVYVRTIEYFVASPLLLSKYIISNGYIPRTLLNTNNPWDNHANTFINYPGSAIVISLLSMITNIDSNLLVYLPIIVVFYTMVLFCFFKLFSGKITCINSLLLTLLVIYAISSWPHTWNLSYHSMGYLSHVLFLYLMVKLFLTNNRNRSRHVISLLLIFMISLLNYYSTSTFSIVFLISLALWALIFKEKENAKSAIKLFVLFFVIYINFDFMLWQVLSYWKLGFVSLFETIIFSIQRFIMGAPTSEELYRYGYPYERSLLDIWLSRINFIFLCSFPIIILLLTYSINETDFVSRRKGRALILASLSVAIYETLPYIIYTGGITFRYLSFFTPIMTVSLAGFILPKLHTSGSIKKKLLCCLLLMLTMLATISAVRLNVLRGPIEGAGPLKTELVHLPEYVTLASYADAKTPFYSNFQVSAELRLASIKVGTEGSTMSNGFAEMIYELYEAIKQHNIEKLSESLRPPSLLVLTHPDFTKPVYGSMWGYTVPPLGEQSKEWLENSLIDLVYNSGKIEAFHIPRVIG